MGEDKNEPITTAINLAYAGKLVSRNVDLALATVKKPMRVPSMSAWIMLEYLESRGGLVPQSELTESIGFKKVNASEVARGVCLKGLARKIISPHNGRYRWLGITPAGREMLEVARPVVAAEAAGVFDGLGITQAQMLGSLASEFLHKNGHGLWLPGEPTERATC